MRRTWEFDRRAWLAGAACALAFVAGVLLLVRAPVSLPALPRADLEPLELRRVVAGDAVSADEAALRDLRPLFLPTEFNAGLRRVPQREPGKTFFDQETVRLSLGEGKWSPGGSLRPVGRINARRAGEAGPVDVLVDREPTSALTGFGRQPAQVPLVVPTGVHVEVTSTANGRRVLAERLPAEARPAEEPLWAPIEYLAAVDAAGLVSPLSVTSRSGFEQVDQFFRDYLTRTFRIGERLPPGFYRISVAP